jgi:hypothetical protein
MKEHRRNLKRLAKRFSISIDEAIQKFYNTQTTNKNIIYSIKKKRNKGINSGLVKNKLNKEELEKLKEKKLKFIRDSKRESRLKNIVKPKTKVD